MSYQIYHDLYIKGSSNKIFEAITQPIHLNNWWPLKSSGKPIVGTAYNFYFSSEYDWFGKVIQSIENKTFHIKMTKSDSDWEPTSFGFDLEEKEDGVSLHFSHVGWPECNQHFKQSSFCWAMLLNGLKNYVEEGTVVPFEDRE